ncbi:esterase-like activity of phytase family protein [Nostoc mirabile]|uniref:esterase-like activity of phytase family protein n=1 Tax=Nostoc mirabile TaxID=2907820 RepID=UPI0035561BE5
MSNNSQTAKTVLDVKLEGQQLFSPNSLSTSAAGTVNGNQTPLGGLSGVVYDVANNVYYSLSDARSDSNGLARFYTFTANLTGISTPQVTFTNATPLKDINGHFFSSNSLNPEGFALTENATVFISSEGEVNINAGSVIYPFIKEFNLSTGKELRSLLIPQKFLPVVDDTDKSGAINTGDTQISGVRDNLAFESLTITPDQHTLYTGVENALIQDGQIATLDTGSRSRILQYNLVTGQTEKEYLYITEPVAEPPKPATPFALNGLVDLLAIDNRGTLLALERSFSAGVSGTGYTIKLYEVSLQGATDISNLNSIPVKISAIQPAHKRLLLNLNQNNLNILIDNIEGLAFGPTLPDGRQSIVLVSDDNFGALGPRPTQILTLSAEVNPIGVTITQTEDSTNVTEGGATDSYTVVLTSQPTDNVTININPGTQTTTNPNQLIFTTQNWNVAQNITVAAVNDALVEGNHSNTIQHTAISNDANYNGIAISSVNVGISEVNPIGATITQTEDSTNVTEGGATDSYTVVLTSQPTDNVTININPGTQTTTNPNQLIFTTQNWNVAQNITVAAVNDALVEGNHSNTIQHTAISNDANYNGIAISSVNVGITDNDIPLAKNADNDIFTIKSNNDKARLQVTVTGQNSSLVNELGFFIVDDAQGRIGGIAPGASAYTQAALNRAKVIFSVIANLPNGFNSTNLTQQLELNSGDSLRFYLVRNNSTDAVNAQTTPTTDVLFSDPTTLKITDFGTEGFSLAWQDTATNTNNFQNLVVKIESTNQPLPLGVNLQTQQQGELIDLRGVTELVKADFVVNREAAFNNFVGFYQVVNENGGIDTNGDSQPDILPGEAGYTQAAVRGRIAGIELTVNNQGTATYIGSLTPGSIFAPFIIVDGRPDAVLDTNFSNDPEVYFPFLGANTDKVDHLRLLGSNIFGFEDLVNGGDRDFNDVIVQVNLSKNIV